MKARRVAGHLLVLLGASAVLASCTASMAPSPTEPAAPTSGETITIPAAVTTAPGIGESALGSFAQGEALAKSGQWEKAVEAYTRAIQIHPKLAPAFNNRGLAYQALEELDLAMADFTKSIDLDSTNASALVNRSYVYQVTGKLDLALADLSKAIDLDPTDALVLVNRGTIYGQQRKPDLAVLDLTRAIELDPTLAGAYFNRGNAYWAQYKLELAIDDLSKAIELDPAHVNARAIRGAARAQLGDTSGATADFEQALALTSDPAAISLITKLRCDVGLGCE